MRAGSLIALVVGVALLLVAGIVAVAVGITGPKPSGAAQAVAAEAPLPASSLTSADGTASAAASKPASIDATAPTADVEVPKVVGKDVKVAEALVTGAGLSVQTRVQDPPAAGVAPDAVVSQWPQAGALVQAGARIVITYQPRAATAAKRGSSFVVVIDPGHQAKADLQLEPIGPGSKVEKPKVAGGATGVVTHVPEYVRVLAISLKLRDALVAEGVKVVMVRTTNDVDIPNSKRASIGNAAKADLVVRVHLDSATDQSVNGISTLFPSGNSWVKPITTPSRAAAQLVQSAVARTTGASSRGLFARGDMSGFNYSTRPTVIVECGFLSNPTEDRRVATAAYQQKIADGLAAGVMAYLKAK
jgi:N-acetylmuramoyl-L-alanine amidase